MDVGDQEKMMMRLAKIRPLPTKMWVQLEQLEKPIIVADIRYCILE